MSIMLKVTRQLHRWEWVILLALLPIFLFPEGYRGLVLVAIPLFWLCRKSVTGYFIPSTPYNTSILVLLLMVAVSLAVSFDSAIHLPKVVGLLMGIELFYAITEFSSRQTLWPVVGVLCAAGALIALLGVVGMVWLPPFETLNNVRQTLLQSTINIPGTVGGIINANELAGVLNWIGPLTVACSIGVGRRLWRTNKLLLILLLIATALIGLVLIASLSRGGILAYGIGVTVVIAAFLSTRWRLVLGIGLLTILLAIVAYTRNSIGQDIVGDALGLSGRLEIWSRALLAISDYPLTGVGINGFRQVIHVLYPLFAISSDIDLAHAHNHLLQAALDVGIPGLVAYLSLWLISAGLLWNTWRNLVKRHSQHHPYFALVAGLCGSLAAGWVFGIFDAVALGARPAFLWWMLLGLTASVHYAVVFSGESLRIHRRSTSHVSTTEETHAVQSSRSGYVSAEK